MSKEKQDLEFDAHQTIYTALKDLDTWQQRKILKSVAALLEIDSPPEAPQAGSRSVAAPVSLAELVTEKSPEANRELIILFAYYREKYELNRRFSRADLEGYFSKARLSLPANYDRDFVEAVMKGWIHEDGSDSYITSKGIETVESSFSSERKHLARKKLTLQSAVRKRREKKNSYS